MGKLENERLGPAFRLDLASGLRLGELLALRWTDIDFNEGSLTVRRSLSQVKLFNDSEKSTQVIFQEPKTKSGRRMIPLSKSIVMEI